MLVNQTIYHWKGINPDVIVTIQRSIGYTTNAAGQRVPTYVPMSARAQVQPTSYNDRVTLDGLNIQGVSRIVYLEAAVTGIIRIDKKGGDQIIFPASLMPEDAPDPVTGNQKVWQVTAILEAYASGWRKCSCTMQNSYSAT